MNYKYDGITSYPGVNFNVLQSPELNVTIDDDLVFINEDYLNEKIEIFTLSLYSDKLYYGRTSTKGIDLVNLEKNRRSKLSIDLEKIGDLKKKVKIGGS